MKALDDLGIPGCFVVTKEFKEATESQSEGLGFEPAIVWVDHPIQNRTAIELEKLAADSVVSILSMITS